ncbi:MAG TPA: hypothetical protein PLS58_03860 [Bacteroidales bacterium]|nr:hypothetical protein [Bacteroidales bacterium]
MNGKFKNGAIIIEGHVQGLSNTRSLGESGIPVFVVDTSDCIARYSKFCTKFFKCPEYIKDEFAVFLIDLAEKEKIKDWVLVPSNDHAVITISKHKRELEKYFKVITPHYRIIEKIYDKLKLTGIARDSGVPVPETYHAVLKPGDIPEDIKFPVLIKGRSGLSFYKKLGKKAFLVHDRIQMDNCLSDINLKNEFENSFIQELIPSDGTNNTVSFTAFCEHGDIKTYWMGIKLREHPIQFGTATFAESVFENDCHVNSVKLLKKLDYTGVCEIEYIRDPRDGLYKLIEMNARTWLWVSLARECGVDYAKYIYCYCQDLPVDFPGKYALGIRWINYFTDTIFSVKAFLAGKLRINEYLTSLKGPRIPAIWNRRDKIPGIMFFVLLPCIIFKRG